MIVFKTPESLILRVFPSFFVFGRLSSNEAKGVFILLSALCFPFR
jgi:hypothetical protein